VNLNSIGLYGRPARMNFGHLWNNAKLLFKVYAEGLFPRLRAYDRRFEKEAC
jgi:hypothetical protein